MQDQPATTTAQPTFERIRINLKGTRGPINYTDLAGDSLPDPPHEELGSDNEMEVDEQPAAAGPPPPAPEPQAAQPPAEPPAPAQPPPQTPQRAVARERERNPRREPAAAPPLQVPQPPPPQVPPRGSPRRSLLDAMMDSEDIGRKLEGLPPVKRTRNDSEYATMQAKLD